MNSSVCALCNAHSFPHLPAQLPISSLSSYLSQRYGTGTVRQKEIKIVEPTLWGQPHRNSNLKHRIAKRLKVLLLSYKTCTI